LCWRELPSACSSRWGIYYGLRGMGVDVYVALLVSTLMSAAPTVVGLFRRRVNALSAYFTTMVLGSVVVSLVVGSSEFLLAKEAALTFVTGVWFLASAFTRRPLALQFSRPPLEGRFRWPSDWDRWWALWPRWRRMWRVSSVLWGLGSIADAVLRVVFAYALPADVVPALATALWALTTVGLIVVTNVFYVLSGVFDRRSGLYSVTPGAMVAAR
jgi:hypothetical protein